MQEILKSKYEVTINSKPLRRIMKNCQLQSVIRRKKPKLFKNTDNLTTPNFLNREFKTDNINQKYVTDISYLITSNATYYLSAVLDLGNRKIASFKVGKRPDASLSCDVITELSKKFNLKNVLIHSDQGVHYTCSKYRNLLFENQVIQSMSRRGNCWDNAIIENFFSHFKSECFRLQKGAMKTFEDVVEIVSEYIEFYNDERVNSALGYLTPNEYSKTISA